jgi:hypothetical protein
MTDPISVLVGAGAVLFGALIAGAFSLLVPHLQTRRDHARWLREARLNAYSDYLSAIDVWMDSATIRWLEAKYNPSSTIGPNQERLDRLEDEVSRAQSRLVLLGPDPVRIVTAEYHHAVVGRVADTQNAETVDDAAAIDLQRLQEARGLMLGVMNRVLGIGPI